MDRINEIRITNAFSQIAKKGKAAAAAAVLTTGGLFAAVTIATPSFFNVEQAIARTTDGGGGEMPTTSDPNPVVGGAEDLQPQDNTTPTATDDIPTNITDDLTTDRGPCGCEDPEEPKVEDPKTPVSKPDPRSVCYAFAYDVDATSQNILLHGANIVVVHERHDGTVINGREVVKIIENVDAPHLGEMMKNRIPASLPNIKLLSSTGISNAQAGNIHTSIVTIHNAGRMSYVAHPQTNISLEACRNYGEVLASGHNIARPAAPAARVPGG